MPGNITNYTVGSTTPVAIVATVTGSTVQIYEAALGTTATWLLYKSVPPTTSGASVPSAVGRLIQVGGVYNASKTLTYAEPYSPGEIICFVKASTGTLTMQCDETGC